MVSEIHAELAKKPGLQRTLQKWLHVVSSSYLRGYEPPAPMPRCPDCAPPVTDSVETRGEPLGFSPGEEPAELEAVTVTAPAGGHVRVRLEDESEQDVPVPEHLSDLLRPGLRIVLYHGPGAGLLGWYLPDRGIGLDLRS
jgi:hypothetical protein